MNMKVAKYATLMGSAVVLPLLAFAQTTLPTGKTGFGETLIRISGFLNDIIVFLVLVATVIFLFGVVRYVTAGGDEEKVKEGRNLIIYGIIALAVMIALWAFVNVAINFFFREGTDVGIPDSTETPQQPDISPFDPD